MGPPPAPGGGPGGGNIVIPPPVNNNGGGGGNAAPATPAETQTVTVTLSIPSISSPGDSYIPPATSTPSPEAMALKVIEDILPPSAKDKASGLLAEIQTGKLTLAELEQSSRLYQILLDDTLDPQTKQFAFEFLTYFAPSDSDLNGLRKLTSSSQDPALARFADLRTAHDAARSLTPDIMWAWRRAVAVGEAGTAAKLAGWSIAKYQDLCFRSSFLGVKGCESQY